MRNHETLRFKGLETIPKPLGGTLTLPKKNQAAVPVVVLVHGTAGVDSRYAFHRPALLDAGIGTFEVDFKTGVFSSLSDRPPIATFQPWAFGAWKGYAPFAQNKTAILQWNAEAAHDSRKRAVAFLQEALGM